MIRFLALCSFFGYLLTPGCVRADDEYMPIAPEPTTEQRDLEYVPKASDSPKSDIGKLETTYDD